MMRSTKGAALLCAKERRSQLAAPQLESRGAEDRQKGGGLEFRRLDLT